MPAALLHLFLPENPMINTLSIPVLQICKFRFSPINPHAEKHEAHAAKKTAIKRAESRKNLPEADF